MLHVYFTLEQPLSLGMRWECYKVTYCMRRETLLPCARRQKKKAYNKLLNQSYSSMKISTKDHTNFPDVLHKSGGKLFYPLYNCMLEHRQEIDA